MPELSERADLPASTLRAKWWAAGICVVLTALVWVVFAQTLAFDFVNYDDPDNVYLNAEVSKGLSFDGFVSAFTTTHVGHWNPITAISHIFVGQFCGIKPFGHHLGNVVLHNVAAILLFLVLWQMTAALWRSAVVAAIFAIHPLRVESVAWVTERKDVLSGVFFMLTLGAYVRYTRQPKSTGRYVSVIGLFALGLMSKSMLVTLPFVLLLLDYWPLERFASAPDQKPVLWRLCQEKIPLFVLAALCSVIQLFADQEGIITTGKLPFLARIANSAVSYATYVGQMFYPVNLVVFYPHPQDTLSAGKTALALGLFISVSAWVLWRRQTRPYLLIGWLWYVGMLIPVIGLVQSGDLAHADRYTYLPQIGLYIAIVWVIASFGSDSRRSFITFCCLSTGVVTALAYAARRQTSYWKDNYSLWQHTLDCNPRNALARDHLGDVFMLEGRVEEAQRQYQQAVESDPDYAVAHNNYGLTLFSAGRPSEAIAEYQQALAIRPDYAAAHNNLGNVFLQSGQLEEAILHFQKAIQFRSNYSIAEQNLGLALVQNGHLAESIEHFERAIKIQPNYANAHAILGRVFMQTGRVWEAVPHLQAAIDGGGNGAAIQVDLGSALLAIGAPRDAINHWELALELDAQFKAATNALAWILATHPDASVRDGVRAISVAERAVQTAEANDVSALRSLAAAYAEGGRFSEAIETAERASSLVVLPSGKALRDALHAEIELYRAGYPFRSEFGAF